MTEITTFKATQEPLYPDLSNLTINDDGYKQYTTRGYNPTDWDLPKGIMKSGWELQQIKAFTEWCNFHLKQSGIEIKKIDEDFRDARQLVTLLENLIGEKIAIQNNGSTRFHQISNMNLAISFIESKGINLTSIGAEEIVDGNLKMTLGLIWMLILNFSLKQVAIDDFTAEKALLEWFLQRTKAYDNFKIENFSTSFMNGLAFCAIIHSYAPQLIDYRMLAEDDSLQNLNLAFSLAEKYFGVPKMLDARTITSNNLDRKSIITYVASLYHALTNYEFGNLQINIEPSEFFTEKEPDDEFNRYLDHVTEPSELIEYGLKKSKNHSSGSNNEKYSLVEISSTTEQDSKILKDRSFDSVKYVDGISHREEDTNELIKVEYLGNNDKKKPENFAYKKEFKKDTMVESEFTDESESELEEIERHSKQEVSSSNEYETSSDSDKSSSDTGDSDGYLTDDTTISKAPAGNQNLDEFNEDSSDSIKKMIYEGIIKQQEEIKQKSEASSSDSDEDSVITTVGSENELANNFQRYENNLDDQSDIENSANIEIKKINRLKKYHKNEIQSDPENVELLKIQKSKRDSNSTTDNGSVDTSANVELLKIQRAQKESDSVSNMAVDREDFIDSKINMSRNYEERYYVKEEREATSDYDDYRRSTSRARSTSRHNSRHRQPQNEDQYYRHKLQGGGGSGSSMSSMSDYEGRERPLVRCPRDVIRAPTPPPVIQRVVERAPTPEADIIERVIVRPQPQQLIERIIERPRTPPPKIIDKEICEPAPPPIVRTRIVKVDHSPRHYYNNQSQSRNQYAPTTSRYDTGYDGYDNQYSYSTTEYPSQAQAQGYSGQAAASAYPSGYQGQAASSAYPSQPQPQAQQQYYSQGTSSPYGYNYGYSGQGQAPSRQQQGFDPRSSQYNQRY